MADDDFEKPILTVDVILFTIREDRLCVVLQRRDKPPFDGRLALIGGYVHTDIDVNADATARRVLKAKAGLDGVFLEQLMTFSGPTRDPRGWSASIAHYALLPQTSLLPVLKRELELVPVEAVGSLPFDHNEIVAKAVQRLRAKGAYSSLPAFLLPPTFTLSQLREMYERVMGAKINDSAFRRKVEELRMVEPVEGEFSKASARPARLFRLRRTDLAEFNRKL